MRWNEVFSAAALKHAIQSALRVPPLGPIGEMLSGLGTCLTYHRVLPGERLRELERSGFAPNIELAVSEEAFDEQIAHLVRHHHPQSVPEAMDRLARGGLPKRSVLITFDDGYRDNLVHALPILRRHGVPAAFYLATGMIDGDEVPWWYELGEIVSASRGIRLEWNGITLDLPMRAPSSRWAAFRKLGILLKRQNAPDHRELMSRLRTLTACAPASPSACEFLSWEEVRELSRDPLVTIGSHTRHHLVLSRLQPAELREELAEGRARLEREIGRPVEHLAYPYGGGDEAAEREFRMAEELGFRSAFTTRPGHLHSFHRGRMWSLPRVFVSYHDTLENFQWKLSGFSAGPRQLRGELGLGWGR